MVFIPCAYRGDYRYKTVFFNRNKDLGINLLYFPYKA